MSFINKIIQEGSIIPSLLNEEAISPEQKELENFTVKIHSLGDIEIIPHHESSCNLIYSSGIHGNETAPIEICAQILNDILMQKIIPKNRTLFLFGNFKGMKEHKRFLDFNLNRLFNDAYKNYDGTYEALRAKELQESVNRFASVPYKKLIHLDLHTAIRSSFLKTFAISPIENDRKNSDMDSILSAMGLEAIVYTNQASTTFSDFGARLKNSIAFTVELGKVNPFGENDMTNFKDAKNTLINLILDKKLEKVSKLRKFEVYKEVIREHENLKFYLDEGLTNFTCVAKDQNIYYQNGEDFSFPEKLFVVFAHPTVKLGQRAGFLLKEV